MLNGSRVASPHKFSYHVGTDGRELKKYKG
jgi:hypothetical protein